MGILGIVLPILAGGASVFFLWRKLRRVYPLLRKYYQIIIILTSAIEKIETATDIIPDGAAQTAATLKRWIRGMLTKEDKAALDAILFQQGYLRKKGGQK